MADFVERYEESIFHKIRFMTPQEEWEELESKIETNEKVIATNEKVIATKDNVIATMSKELDDLKHLLQQAGISSEDWLKK